VAIQEVADAFVAARQSALNVARRAAQREEDAALTNAPGRTKRKRESEDEPTGSQSGPQTRSQRRKAEAQTDGANEVMVIDEDNEDADFVPEDGLVACPICNQRMKAEQVFPHLDRCESDLADGRKPPNHKPSRLSTPKITKQLPPQPPPERLPQLSYSLLNEKALRKKLSELGIPSFGSKSLLIRRHTEWIALWNSNCDSPRPRLKKELLAELDTWERSQGGHAPNGVTGQPSAVMRKDFDGEGWARKNKDDFDLLIANARQIRKVPASSGDDNEKSDKSAPMEQHNLSTLLQLKTSISSGSQHPSPLDLTRITSIGKDNMNTSSPRSPPSIFTQLDCQPPNQARRVSLQLETNIIPISPRNSRRSSIVYDLSGIPSSPKTNGKRLPEPIMISDGGVVDTESDELRKESMLTRELDGEGDKTRRKIPMFEVPQNPA